jgi:hypothetical protein
MVSTLKAKAGFPSSTSSNQTSPTYNPRGSGPMDGGTNMKKGGKVRSSTSAKASSASKRGDGIAMKGKTRGRFI